MHSQNIPRHSLETFLDALWEFCKYLLNALSKPSGNFQTLRKLSGNSLRHWKHFWKPSVDSLDAQETFRKLSRHCKHPLETLSQLLDTLELLKILAGCSVRNSQATLQTLRKPSENSLRHRKHHLKASSELSGHWKFTKYFPDALSETLRQLSGHSGNILETH